VTVTLIKVVHGVVFGLLCVCVLLVLYSGVANHITVWTWAAMGLIAVESAVLAWCDWTCPLTILAERLGARNGAVADIFLPKWFADRLLAICGTVFLLACAIVGLRLLTS